MKHCVLQTAIFKVASLVSKQNLLPITVQYKITKDLVIWYDPQGLNNYNTE